MKMIVLLVTKTEDHTGIIIVRHKLEFEAIIGTHSQEQVRSGLLLSSLSEPVPTIASDSCS